MNTSRRQALIRLAVMGGGVYGAKPAQRPNILFVMTDDQAVSEMSCYGNKILKTPNMDRLAAEGTRFNSCFVTNSLCAPSRATVITGCYSHVHGVSSNPSSRPSVGAAPPSVPTFPELLQQAGYRTGLVGKWHLGDRPPGFDYWCILPGQGKYFDPEFIDNGTRKTLRGYVTDIATDLALGFLRAKQSQPFCLLYHPKAPHRPFTPAPRHARLFDDIDLPYPETFDDDYATRPIAKLAQDMRFDVEFPRDYKNIPAGLSAEEKKRWIYQRFVKDHYRAVYGVDENLGRLLGYLDEQNLAANTLVLYTSDNGFFLGDHGWYDKRFMYEPSIRIPLLVRYPRLPRKTVVDDHMVLNVDFAPTVLDFAGIPIPASMQGKSLRPMLEGRSPGEWRRTMYYAYHESPEMSGHRVPRHRGIRGGRFKLIKYLGVGDDWELFDLEADPNELRNLYGRPAYREITASLKAELNRLRIQYRDNL